MVVVRLSIATFTGFFVKRDYSFIRRVVLVTPNFVTMIFHVQNFSSISSAPQYTKDKKDKIHAGR
jgi:hypothetical protein